MLDLHNEPLLQLISKLQDHLANNETEVCINHDMAAAAFPQSHIFDDRKVNWNTQEEWSDINGWTVRPLTEETPVEDRHRPYILFTKIF